MSTYTPAEVVEVRAWGRRVGAAAIDPNVNAFVFEYAPDWRAGSIELAPFHVPNQAGVFAFPELDEGTWKRLPPFLADSLPDDFGNAIVNTWMARQGIDRANITALDRLVYTAHRGMGALTFHPPAAEAFAEPTALALADIVTTARQVLAGDLNDSTDATGGTAPAEEALRQLILVGSSAGGARAKAVIAYNPDTQQIRSGQFDAPSGFSHWLVKLDGVVGGHDRGVAITSGTDYGRIEYAYYLMATEAGIHMAPCRLLPEGDRAHFLTKRFDRTDTNERLHMQSLCALDHLSFRQPGVHSYEQLLLAADRLQLGAVTRSEILRRCVFNVAAVNRDDHTKNTAFLCTPDGAWSLAPAFDITHSYRVDSEWVARHQMSVNGKTEGITKADFEQMADRFAIPASKAIIGEVLDAVKSWPTHAASAGVSESTIETVAADMASFAPE